MAGRDVHVRHRSRAGREGHRRGRPVHGSAAERDRALRGCEVPGPGAGPDRADAADAARAARATHPRLPRHGTTTCSRRWRSVATGKVTATYQPRHRPHEFLRFLKQVARAYPERELHLVMHNYAAHKRVEIRDWLAHNPAHAGAPHADLSVLDEPGRGLVRHHRTSGNPPRHLGQRPRPDHQDPRLHRRLERPLPPIRLDQDRKQILTRANRQKTSNTTILSAWVSAAWVTGELLAVPAASARRRRSGGRG